MYKLFLILLVLFGIIYLPITISGSRLTGVEISPGVTSYLDKLQELNPKWIRTYIKWSDAEVIKGVFTWNENFDNDLLLLENNKLIVVIKMSPEWAREGSECSRIKEENIPDFVNFVEQVILRYPTIKYLEIGNEQDVEYGADGYYGCWGRSTEPYFGGFYYTKVMNSVYKLKQNYPNITFIYGGLADINSGFLEGSLISGVNFDILSFHRYFWVGNPSNIKSSIDKIKELMNKYNRVRPIILTETAIVCDTPCEQEQADYARTLPKQARDNNLIGYIWYILPYNSWYNTSLLREDGTPTLAYKELLP